MSMQSDEELAGLACAGDQAALEALFCRYQLTLRAQVASQVAQAEDVLDIVQDAFVDIVRGLHTYQPGRPVLPWMRVICRNRMFQYLRTLRKMSATDIDALHLTCAAVEARAWDGPAIAHLQKCLENLPDNARTLVHQRYVLSHTVIDMAAALGVTANVLMVRLHRLRGTLRRCLQEKGVQA